MDTFEKLDKVDLQILRTLQENARLTTKELAQSFIDSCFRAP
jgi:Lrp/AsnC family leucine-responsive transcriptional regulator